MLTLQIKPFWIASLLLLALSLPADAGGKTSIRVPTATSVGEFTGTWARVEPGQRHALWIRQQNGEWQARLYWRVAEGFSVDTEWKQRTEFDYRGFPGSIELRVDNQRSTDDRLLVAYKRTQSGEKGSLLVEQGELNLFRSSYNGRALVWQIDPLQRRLTVEQAMTPEEEDSGIVETQQVWTFMKHSIRMLLLDELYW